MSAAIARLRANKAAQWWIRYVARWLVVILAVVAWSLAMVRVGQRKALLQYQAWMDEAQQVQRLEIDKNGGDPDYFTQLNAEAEQLARVLYGVRDNDTDDLRTMCWCVFNRVDNPAFPGTLEDVIAQPQQWMRYSEDSPVLENLYQIAADELDAWHTLHRPCSSDYVFMSWTPSDICLRDAWAEGSGTHYWRYTA